MTALVTCLSIKTRPKQNRSESLNQKERNSLVWIETQNVVVRSDCPEDFSRSSSGSPEADR